MSALTNATPGYANARKAMNIRDFLLLFLAALLSADG